MNVSPINSSSDYNKQSFKAKIPYTRKIDAAFNHAERLLTKTTHKYNPHDADDILLHPSPKLEVYDFCENIKYLLSDKFKPNETLELGFEYSSLYHAPRLGYIYIDPPPLDHFGWNTDIRLKDAEKVTERVYCGAMCLTSTNLKQVREQACFDALNSYGYNKRCPEPDLTYCSQSRLNEMHDQELQERNNLEKNLTIEDVKTKLLELKEQLMKNTVFERESIKENPKDNLQLVRYFQEYRQ